MQPNQVPVPIPQTSTPQPQTAPVSAPQPYKQSKVVYLTGMNRLNQSNRHPAVLEWSADNRIRLYVTDGTSGTQTFMLDCAPQDIKRFSTGMGVANIILRSGQRSTVEFSSQVSNQLIAGAVASQFGVVGLAGATAIDKAAVQTEAATDIGWWTENLKRFGVGGLQTSANTMYKIDKAGWWVIGIIFGVVAIFGFIALIIYLISAAGIA